MTAPSEEVKLLPCPFCGSEAAIEEDMGIILCSGCGFSYDMNAPTEDAVAAWNTRHSSPVPASPEDAESNCGHADCLAERKRLRSEAGKARAEGRAEAFRMARVILEEYHAGRCIDMECSCVIGDAQAKLKARAAALRRERK